MTIIDYSRLSERQLVELTQNGDDAAFTDLVNVYRSPLYGHAIRRLRDPGAAEDALQETFLRAYKGLPKFNGEYKVGPWLHRIMENVCVDEGNRRRREADKYDRVIADPKVVELSPGIEDQLGLHIDDAGVNEALASLPVNYQEALILRFVEGLEYEEVAAAAGVSEQNARARVSRARSAARAMLRGVAAFPVFMVGLFRRGERHAAAALNSHASSEALVDQSQSLSSAAVAGGGAAASAAAGAAGVAGTATATGGVAVGVTTTAVATPLLSKAAISVGLAVAVAVPTAGPQIVDRVIRPAPAVAPPATDGADLDENSVGLAQLSSVSVGASSASGANETGKQNAGEGKTSDEISLVEAVEAEVAKKTPSGSAGVVALPNPTTPPSSDSNSSGEAGSIPPPSPNLGNIVPEPVERFDGSIEATGLHSTPAGPRLDIGGVTQLVVYGEAIEANFDGRFELPEWPALPAAGATGEDHDADDVDSNTEAMSAQLNDLAPKRMSANITLAIAGAESVVVRLAGHARPQPDAPWGAVSLSGQFTSSSSNAVALITSGNFTGAWNPTTGSLKLSLNR